LELSPWRLPNELQMWRRSATRVVFTRAREVVAASPACHTGPAALQAEIVSWPFAAPMLENC
jgi:hypothetical protein